ncbi:MAG: carbohydrate kinase [Candidatus Accumulibacter sp.]|nr:carbohydrate kinase [Accumulibacter sp.]
MSDIAVFGEILIDFTFHGFGAAGQRLFAQNPGGAPANVAVAARRLGSRAAFLGKAGKDMHGAFLKETLDRLGVDTRGLILDERYFTTLAFVALDERGERHFSFARKPGADTMIESGEIDMEILLASRIFHVGSLSLTGEPGRSATLFALEKAKSAGIVVSYDPNYRASLWPDDETARRRLRALVPFADVMKISEEESALLTDEESPEAAAAALCGRGVKLAVVTLGERGAYVRTPAGGRFVAGFPSKAVDTNGAGDAFWGGFLHRLNESGRRPENVSLDEASRFAAFANAAASICVEGHGAIPAMPGREEVLERLESNGKRSAPFCVRH